MKNQTDEFSQDLMVTSLIYIIVFAFGYLLSTQYQLDKQKVEIIKAQKVAVELYEEKKAVEDRLEIAHENLGSLNSELDKYEKAETTIQKVIKELP